MVKHTKSTQGSIKKVQIEHIIGDYKEFFTDLQKQLQQIPLDIREYRLSHLNYRVATQEEYEAKRNQLKMLCSEFVETPFNGRAVALCVLKEPLALAPGYVVAMIELPAPRAAHMYPSGLEHLGVNIGDDLPMFKERYKDVITDIKDRRPYCWPACITFSNGHTAKFYERSLYEVVLMQGWTFEKLH